MSKSSGIDGMDFLTITSSAEITLCLRLIRKPIDKLISASFDISWYEFFLDISVSGIYSEADSCKYTYNIGDMNKKGKEKMEDNASASFSRNKIILPKKYEADLSQLVQMNDAAWTLLHMKRQHLSSRTANHLQELIDKNNQTCVLPNVRASFPKESRTANHLQELIGKNNQNCAPPDQVRASFPKESLPHLVGQFSSCLTKELTLSDIRSNQMRLMFPKSFVENDINPLLKDGESPKRGIPTTLYFVNPKTKEDGCFPMTYKSWGEDKTFVLTSGWSTFVTKCKINVGDTIKLWAFRHSETEIETGDLRFAATLSLQDGRL